MNDTQIVSKINEFLLEANRQLVNWLKKRLPKISDKWFSECVIGNLTPNQLKIAREKNFSKLEDFDLAALLVVTYRNWYAMRSTGEYLPTQERECVRDMRQVRNGWAHCSGSLPSKDVIVEHLLTIETFLGQLGTKESLISNVRNLRTEIETGYSPTRIPPSTLPTTPVTIQDPNEIKQMDQVYLVSEPEVTGLVINVESLGNQKRYLVFVNGRQQTFYAGQIAKKGLTEIQSWLDIATFQSYLTAYEINNPSAGCLYSLNSARIDFVPYQFRPALKLIKSDSPRILIADSVGVGKTIEAGIIIKELEARNELNNIAVICPRPLVAERKWELEMLRFDEEFTPLNGATLRQIISDTNMDEEWPSRFNRVIMPYSIFDEGIYEGVQDKKAHCIGLKNLNPAPHFDLVIVDEAHYIRNGSMDKEKAYGYKCTKYFCDHADAVVMLTATPLQTGDDDLFTILNILRPDLIIDKATLNMLMRPNANITTAAKLARTADEGWQEKVKTELQEVLKTQWGGNVISKNPAYAESLSLLELGDSITLEQRVKLISNIESLHSLNNLMNRTRRKDIQDFCIRTSQAPAIEFTQEQKELYNDLLAFESIALSKLHNVRNVNFMMSTIKRQASSCIFGLAPFITDIINRRLDELISDDSDYDSINGDNHFDIFKELADKIINKAQNLSGEDPKFDIVLKAIKDKQQEENNKILIFSTFRHTLSYLEDRLKKEGLRVAQINGGSADDVRCEMRDRFELPKKDQNAIDILLFTEVGAEGLDYQFCNMMINYDLPWNPMKIEQRIGRIDRRGQKSDKVLIYNPLTKGTIDEEIYNRCLKRIGIFERSIGDCDEILGQITSQIKDVAESITLSEEEKKKRLEQIAANEIRKMQEYEKLESDEKGLFGFNLSEYMISKDVEHSEGNWTSPGQIEKMVKKYLAERLKKDKSILGESAKKNLCLAGEDKRTLLQDFRNLSLSNSSVKRKWETFLKDVNPHHEITFDSDLAKTNRKAFFITAMHPLAKQAAKYFATDAPKYINVKIASDIVEKGTYPFEVYGWNFKGINNRFQLKMVCKNDALKNELVSILQDAQSVYMDSQPNRNIWDGLEQIHVTMWENAKKQHLQDMLQLISYREETLRSNFENRKHLIERQINISVDENVIRMRQAELHNASVKFEARIQELEALKSRTDIMTCQLVKGVLTVE